MAKLAFYEAIIGLDVDLTESEIEGYAKSFERYQARWTQDVNKEEDGEDGHRKGLEEWDRAGDELVRKFERVVGLVCTVLLFPFPIRCY